ncbi:penicillin-binding transpeptidase domain-containing protein [Paenarthrobacter sp. PH39-S1]|uniref:penicillin-binding transpeptidase domain-containing protein n=1 Tax=Paenarthrobacter sp. PH39-S1 TaxID=3046204 RepID=UPI0024B9E560|nr:penicillin-binding transpeptidase domain-containing protein [Paenarthrobacter sp. PH39-S1]MDJ0357826.1 penicillin-binding transpeptidase domain-containing protein [Paenarthrobacter sp. PH39-S1]
MLGTVGDATAELIDKSGGKLQAGDVTGLSGLQQQYDGQLSCTPGITVSRVPAPAGGSGPGPATGADPQQMSAPQALFSAEPKAGTPIVTTLNVKLQNLAESVLADQAGAAAIVAIRPSNGGVVAAASRPGSNGYDNTAFISQQAAVPQGDLASAAASLGISVDDQQLGAPAFFGTVPASAVGTEHAAFMIGQGKVLVSPPSIATVAASVVHGGLVSPRLVLPAPGGSGTASPKAQAAPSPAAHAPTAHAPTLAGPTSKAADIMRAVVISGHAGFLADVPGGPVLAKTGTAEYGTELPLKTHAWIIAAQGDLAVAVFVEDNDYGSVSGGPPLKAFLTGAAGCPCDGSGRQQPSPRSARPAPGIESGRG